MDKLNRFLLKEFFIKFFSIFFIFLIIVSLIVIISISNITSSFQITFLELTKMYLLSLPQIIFISLSISFFIAAVNVYASISETQELIALFSLGFSKEKILRPIFLIAFIFTLINIFILFISIPYSKLAFKNFKIKKQQEAKFNLKNSQISQKLGDWILFANQGDKNTFKNIYLFNPQKREFILADSSLLKVRNRILYFNLYKGKIYDLNKSFKILFNSMQIHQIIPTVNLSIFNLKNYFNYNKKIFIKNLPFALLPIALFFFIPLFSFFHPRLHKNRSLIYSIFLLSLYLILTFTNKNIYLSIIIPLIFSIIGIFFYRRIKF